jgi:uncharacterized protein YukE
MGGRKGQDTERVEAIAARLKAAATTLDAVLADADLAVARLDGAWRGGDREAFQRRWRRDRAQLAEVPQSVRDMSTTLYRELHEQDVASAVEGHQGPRGPLDQTTELPTTPADDIPDDPDIPPLTGAEAVFQLLFGDLPFTPQGLAVDESGTVRVTTMYSDLDVENGLLVIQDNRTGEVLSVVRLDGIDHYGGVAVHGDHVWVSGGGQAQLYSLSDLRGATDGDTATPRDTFPIQGHSTVTYHDGQLWTAEFDGDGTGQVHAYDVRPDGTVADAPAASLTGEKEVQGIAVTDRYVYLSQSEGRHAEGSTLTRIDRVTGERESVEVASNMAEGIALDGNRLVTTYESGAHQYADGSEPRGTSSVRDLRPRSR